MRNIIFYIASGIGAAMLAVLLYQTYKLDNTRKMLESERQLTVQLERSNENLANSIEKFQADLEANREELQRVNLLLSDVREENRQRQTDLQRAMGRQETVFRRPTLVERMAQRSFTEFTDRYSCITGAKERCSESQD